MWSSLRALGGKSFIYTRTFTRQGALTAAHALRSPAVTSPAKRFGALLIGAVFIGAGVATFHAAHLGLPPYDVALSAISDHLPLTHGQAGWLFAGVLLLIAAALGQFPAVTTIMFVLAIGVAVDVAFALVNTPTDPATRAVLLVVGTAAIAAGASFVVFSGLTGGAFELLMAAGEARGISKPTVRTGLEFTTLIGGIAAGGTFGIGTVVFALSIGPVMRAIGQALVDHREGRRIRTRPVPG